MIVYCGQLYYQVLQGLKYLNGVNMNGCLTQFLNRSSSQGRCSSWDFYVTLPCSSRFVVELSQR